MIMMLPMLEDDFKNFHELKWWRVSSSNNKDFPLYVKSGFEVVFGPNVMHTDLIDEFEQWLRDHCTKGWKCLVKYSLSIEQNDIHNVLIDYDTFVRFECEQDAIMTRLTFG